ncbi:DUF3097 domain-containing protein [Jatrophihabitans lederbergiae]|uniref:DUF3097 domain-containing protein n=1 Tax=Jatrophihabitans lederbergiae TaxID=3075547 RepID=A0ABU2J6R1_9ACTN|nr:DUF3097 domain-containing protein [Jatrophihabitans sp. DSM 44399]MDT0260677.1 DUF3097 domain-containing protein [Jatrophihabitans sp. DSM 44399]
MYSDDVLADRLPRRRKVVREVPADLDLVVETSDGRFCGAVVAVGKTVVAGEQRDTVTLADRLDRERVFPMLPASFLLEGEVVTLVRPVATPAAPVKPGRTASGSVAVAGVRAQVAKASRIWVEGVHDAALVERIWGEDLRIEGIVVEPLGGIDDLAAQVREFRPGPTRRLGVLVDHLVPNSKESRIAATVTSPHVLINGHPYVDVWQAVKPTALGIDRWPVIPRDIEWKVGIATALGVSDSREMWRRVLGSVNSFADVEVPLLRSVEELIDFVTVGQSA